MEFASQGCLELTGYAPEELMENKINYNNLIHPDDRSEVRKSIQIAVSQRETYTLGYRLLDAAGVEKWIWEKGQGIYDRKGKLVALEGFISDISNLERVQQALQQSEERLRRAVLDAPFPIMIHAEGGEILETSHTWEELSGYSREDVPTMIDWLRAAHGEAAEAALAEVNRIYERTDRKHNGEYTILSRQGETLTWDFSSAPLGRLADGRRLGISMAMDVTHRKHSEEQLRHIAEELVRSNAELEQFAYVASHDLQEPLRMVASYLQLLERRYGQLFDQDGHEFIQFAVEGATRMKALINDLLAYSRVGTHGREMEPVDLDGALSQALTNLTLVIEDHQAVVQADPLPTVLGDEVQMIQLFQNLIGNAIKFHSEAPPQVQVCVEREENQWRFSIHDNGIGFDPQYASRIFVIFKRLNQQEAYPGTGIGLAISKRIVERHFGKIWCESVPGQGSTFFFSLPVLNESIPL
jgi:PAS domain S-box-containing protein